MFPNRFLGDHSVFLDVDGTLIDIAHRPDAVVVSASLVHDLDLAAERLGGALALISGRTIEDLDRLFAPLRLRASGVHGAEFRFDPDSPIQHSGARLPPESWTDLLNLLPAFPGTLAENKTFSYAVHYRKAPEHRSAIEAALDRYIQERPELGLRLMPGHFVFEMKPPAINKGAAIARFLDVEDFKGRRPIFIGDDVTDRAGFDIVVAQNGLAYSVGPAIPGVTGTFASPAAVRDWLSAIARLEKQTV